MIDWIPAGVAHPLALCAVLGCGSPRWRQPLVGGDYVPRRFCAIHCAIREQEIQQAGGGLLLAMEDADV